MGSGSYPIVPNEEENKRLDEWLSIIRNENEPNARKVWRFIYDSWSSEPVTCVSKATFSWGREEYVFDPLKAPQMDHILKAVLLVAMRFNWPPEEILALWQIEGLVCYTGVGVTQDCVAHGNLAQERWSDYWPVKASMGKYGCEPANDQEARAFARSILLYNWFGLDILVPTRWDSVIKDNVIAGVPGEEHNKKFRTMFAKEIAPILGESPLDYLMSERGPILVRKRLYQHESDIYRYSVHSSYMTTMLAMQYGRFKYLESVIQRDYTKNGELSVRGVKIELKPPFPALVRMFYNCGKRENRRTLIRALVKLAEKHLRRVAKKPAKLASDDLMELFRVLKAPPILGPYLRGRPRGPGQCYLGGRRFEMLRETYELLFRGIL